LFLTYKINTGLTNIITGIQKFAEVVVESKPCEMVFVRRKDKEAQMMVAELSPPKDPVLSLPIWNNSFPSLLMNLTLLDP
jgi:hypothetical protein